MMRFWAVLAAAQCALTSPVPEAPESNLETSSRDGIGTGVRIRIAPPNAIPNGCKATFGDRTHVFFISRAQPWKVVNAQSGPTLPSPARRLPDNSPQPKPVKLPGTLHNRIPVVTSAVTIPQGAGLGALGGLARAIAQDTDVTVTVRSTRTQTRTVTVKQNKNTATKPAVIATSALETPSAPGLKAASYQDSMIRQIGDGQIQGPAAPAPSPPVVAETSIKATPFAPLQSDAPRISQIGDGQIQAAPTLNIPTKVKRQEASATALRMYLNDGVLMDVLGRTGYIASNRQLQFDAPPQAGSIYTSGFSLCTVGSELMLTLGNNNLWYSCASGDPSQKDKFFGNLYDESIAAQCTSTTLVTTIWNGTAVYAVDSAPMKTPQCVLDGAKCHACVERDYATCPPCVFDNPPCQS